ncbi:MAG: hypothetical protein C0613_04165 [Desulfobulbaceae bacterium]|nr:MAG: hypothetical protein C0613_04165 [Desulfobulbaceae bacterium]
MILDELSEGKMICAGVARLLTRAAAIHMFSHYIFLHPPFPAKIRAGRAAGDSAPQRPCLKKGGTPYR